MADDSGTSERGIAGVSTVVQQPTKLHSEGMAAAVHAFKKGIGSAVVQHESMPEVKKGLLEWAKRLVSNLPQNKK